MKNLMWAGSFLLGAIVASLIGEYAVRALRIGEEAAFASMAKNGGVDDFTIITDLEEQNPSADQDSEFTDLTILTCENSSTSTSTISGLIREALNGRFGSVKLATIQPTRRLARILDGYLTVVYDFQHDERNEIPNILSLVEQQQIGPPFQILENTGNPSEWRLSIFAC
ncbi:hypothetical protein EOK75_11450 [Pseudorhodobacter turbinis]|uniref:Uncharacterized protein n=1 Tax=Pseudorhodobacter turbinis TaxID=2500533 RepID=A0A4P8EGK7_9RHOB|nr:hypothetical protein [Pseudorhodobacter turbinis]QCO56290.1 hypothetical protein EOK75_11450 [Pseudorhodobacter turbinis]